MSETPTLPPQSSEQYQIPEPSAPRPNDPDYGNSFVGHSISEEARIAREIMERPETTQPVALPQPDASENIPDTKLLSKGAKFGIAAGTVVAGAAIAVQGMGGGLSPVEQAPLPEVAPSIETLVQSSFDADAYLGDFEITSGTALIDQAEALIANSVGEHAWSDTRANKYDYLLDSAKAVNALFPAPGTKTYVVELELDNNPQNGNEYIVTLGSPQLSLDTTGEIPSPTQK